MWPFKRKAATPAQINEIIKPEIKESDLSPELLAQLALKFRAMYPTEVVRDCGIHSRNVQDAVDIIREASPVANMYLDRLGFTNYGIRDLTEDIRQTLLRKFEWLVTSNPMANRGMGIRTDLICSEGFEIIASSTNPEYRDATQRCLDDHWELNEWEDRMWERVFDLGLLGEMIRVKPDTTFDHNSKLHHVGRFECSAILPHSVCRLYVDPLNMERLTHLELMPYAGCNNPMFPIVHKAKYGSAAGQWVGQAFYTAVNRRLGATRGMSDLMAVMEWLDVYDQLLFNEAERTAMLLRFVWDVTMEGATTEEIEARLKKLKAKPPGRGTVMAHNEREKWNAVQPKLEATQSDILLNRVFLYIWGGMGMPEHWYSAANTVNRASAQEMDGPVFGWTRARRRKVTRALQVELEYAVQVAHRAGRLRIPLAEFREHSGFKIKSRDPDRTSYDVNATALKALTEAVSMGLASGIVSQAAATEMFMSASSIMGFDVSPQVQQAVKAGEASLSAAFASAQNELEKKRAELAKTYVDPPDEEAA